MTTFFYLNELISIYNLNPPPFLGSSSAFRKPCPNLPSHPICDRAAPLGTSFQSGLDCDRAYSREPGSPHPTSSPSRSPERNAVGKNKRLIEDTEDSLKRGKGEKGNGLFQQFAASRSGGCTIRRSETYDSNIELMSKYIACVSFCSCVDVSFLKPFRS